MNNLNMVAWWLVVIGGLNWGLDALNFNVVDLIFAGWWPLGATIVYYLVGLSALLLLAKKFGKM